MFGRTLAAAALMAGAFLVPATTASAATPAAPAHADGFGACMDYAAGLHEIEPWLAHDACGADSFEQCYWILRRADTPAVIAATACRLADA
jgi:hypothetical protein